MTIVSNSDIETSQKCEKMFYFSRIHGGRGISPRLLPPALARGSFGHDMMEQGFKTIMNGGDLESATNAAAEVLQTLLQSGDPNAAEMMGVFRHVCAFFEFATSERCIWRPVALEDRGMWNITKNMPMPEGKEWQSDSQYKDDLIFGYTPDLVVEFVSGLYKGQHAVLDYKFIGQYMKEIAITMSQQIPKYIIYRNKTKTDFKIRRGAFIQLNTRAKPDEGGHKLFLIKWIEPTKADFQTIEEENEIAVSRVAKLYEPGYRHIRTANKDVCNWCFFGQDICPMERGGKDISKVVERQYKPNDYGYKVTDAK